MAERKKAPNSKTSDGMRASASPKKVFAKPLAEFNKHQSELLLSNLDRTVNHGDLHPQDVRFSRLASMWLVLEKFRSESGYPNLDERLSHEGVDQLSVFFHIRYYLKYGLYPPPELLLTVIDLFDEYLEAKGGLKAEHAFFGMRTPTPGTLAKEWDGDRRLGDLDEAIGMRGEKSQSEIELEFAERWKVDHEAIKKMALDARRNTMTRRSTKFLR